MSKLTDKQIEAQVLAIRRSVKDGSQHVAIQSVDQWTGPDRLVIDGVEHLILPCLSDLQIREALMTADEANCPSVILCSVAESKIGEDVINRLAKRRVFAPQVREMLAELFSVSPARIDPRVLKTKPLMNALLERVPASGYPPVGGGTLDLQTAWLALLSQMFGEVVESPSLTGFLKWSLDSRKLRTLSEMDSDLRAAFVEWLVLARGNSVRFMIAAIDSGFGADLVPLGAAMGLIFDPGHHRDAEHQTARGRLERYFQHQEIDTESARSWSGASSSVLERMEEEDASKARRLLLNRVDDLIGDLGLRENAWASGHSPVGLEQRYEQVGQALQRALSAKSSASLDEVRAGLTSIRRHLLGGDDPDRLDRVEMACRLIRYLQTNDAGLVGNPFDRMVVQYHQEGGFLDWARNRLKETDESPKVQKAYDAILEKVDEIAEAFEKNFALQLKDWTRNEQRSEKVVLIEDVLKEIVTPVAKQRPLLLLVLDGMSTAVFRQLLQDILRHDWTEVRSEERALPRPVLATLPCVTNISRRALFLGRLDPGTNGTEEGEFRKNDFLFHETGSQKRPHLFKLGDLTDGQQGGLALKVRDTIQDKKCRVVSVVLNAIDDELDGGKQTNLRWTRNTIRGFRDLLRQAADSERLVLMTSDHGHVLDSGTTCLPSIKGERGDRYRTSTGEVEEGELEFEGSRITKATGDNRITLAWSAGVRYGKGKRGYHGGANPQEMVVPMAVLADLKGDLPDGWQAVASYQPAWWRIEASEVVPAPVAKPVPAKEVAGLDLFEESAKKASAEPVWISALLASPIYQSQCENAVRGAPEPAMLTKLLAGLHRRGGTAVKPALAQELGMPPFRVDGFIQNVSRIVNIDGYEVLSFDRSSDTVALNVELLRTQFDLPK